MSIVVFKGYVYDAGKGEIRIYVKAKYRKFLRPFLNKTIYFIAIPQEVEEE